MNLRLPLTRDAFIEKFGGVYEHSPWVASTFFDDGEPRETAPVDELDETFAAIVDAAGEDAQLRLLRAHPDLAGRLAISGELTEASSAEQRGAGLDNCTPEEFEEFQRLNAEYVEKNGFPFILAVSGFNRGDILENFRSRIGNDRAREFLTALTQVRRIARIRLENIAKEENS